MLKLTPVHSRRVVSCPVQPQACNWDCVLRHNFSCMKRMCWTTGIWRSCLSLEVMSSIPAGTTIIYRFLCGFICISLCQSIKIKPTNIYNVLPQWMKEILFCVRHKTGLNLPVPKQHMWGLMLWVLHLFVYPLRGTQLVTEIWRLTSWILLLGPS